MWEAPNSFKRQEGKQWRGNQWPTTSALLIHLHRVNKAVSVINSLDAQSVRRTFQPTNYRLRLFARGSRSERFEPVSEQIHWAESKQQSRVWSYMQGQTSSSRPQLHSGSSFHLSWFLCLYTKLLKGQKLCLFTLYSADNTHCFHKQINSLQQTVYELWKGCG